jgi:hypothetical protein
VGLCKPWRDGSTPLRYEALTLDLASIGRITLAGTVVAFERSAETEANPSVGYKGSAEWIVIVRDLRTGRTLRTVPTGTITPPEPRVARHRTDHRHGRQA